MIGYLLNPIRSAYVFAAAILIGYAVIPIAFYFETGVNNGYIELASIAATAAGGILIGFIGSNAENTTVGKIEMSMETFTALIWIPFFISAILIIATAPAIPLVTAISGGSADLIALQREEFLKSRQGAAAVFVYVNAFFTGALIPYSVSLMFINNFRWRWILTLLFIIYSISFVEKAFFLKIMLPLLYLFGAGKVKSKFGPNTTLAVAAGILLFVTTVSGSGSDIVASNSSTDFFSSDYAPSSPLMHIIWRSIAVPVFTAADSLRVFYLYFHGNQLNGATSSFFAAAFGIQRIAFERIVFEFQWGQNETGTGSSNSVYIIEAFVNFGWYGVVLFSAFVGRSLKWFARSRDEAFRAVWPLYVLGLYSAGLIGQLLSNGFFVILLIGLFIHVRPHSRLKPAYGNWGMT